MSYFTYVIIFFIISSIYYWYKYKDRDALFLLKYGILALLVDLWRIVDYKILQLPDNITDITFYLRIAIGIFILYKLTIFVIRLFNKKNVK